MRGWCAIGLMFGTVACKERAPSTAVAQPRVSAEARLVDAVVVDAVVVDAVVVDAAPLPRPEHRGGNLTDEDGTVIAVSSTSASAEHRATDLIDDSDNSSWHSRANDLVGAWIAFRVPPTTVVDSVELVVGDVGPGARRFVAHPRVKRVHVTRLAPKADLGSFDLDVEQREPQAIVLNQPGGDFRITVTDVVPGTDTSATELVIPDLAIWGTSVPHKGRKLPASVVKVGSLDGKPLPTIQEIDVNELAQVDSIASFCAAAAADPTHKWDAVHSKNQAPTCGEPETGPNLDLPAGWSAQYFRPSWGEDVASCEMLLHVRHETYVLEDFGSNCGAVEYSWCTGLNSVTQVGSWTAIVTTSETPEAEKFWTTESDATIQLRVCKTLAPGLACSDVITIGVLTCEGHGEGEPGADGLVVNETHTTLTPILTDGGLRLSLGEIAPAHAKPDPDLKAAVGRYRLVVR